VKILERPRCRRPPLALVARRVLGRSVGLLGRRRQPDETELADLHAGPELDRQCRDVRQLERDVSTESRVDEACGGVGEKAEPTKRALAFQTRGHVIRKRHEFVGGTEHELPRMQDERLIGRGLDEPGEIGLVDSRVDEWILVVVEESEKAVEPHVDARRLDHRRIVGLEPDASGVEFELDIAVREQHSRQPIEANSRPIHSAMTTHAVTTTTLFFMTRELQQEIIQALHVEAAIDAAAQVDRRVQFLADYLASTGAAGLVLGVSGGQDSSLAGRLCQLAVERVTAAGGTAELIAVRLPYDVQADEQDAQLALKFIRPSRTIDFNVKRAVDGVQDEFLEAVGERISDFTKGNTKARSRMVAQYAIAGQHAMLVVGTDHAAEAVTGFFTKFGDGGADILPLSGLSKRQGRALLEYLEAPARLYEKLPTADLLDEAPGQTDEANLGITYSDIDDFLEGRDVADAIAETIEARYLATRHKREAPVTMFDEWWRAEANLWSR
jgi:NAD+ synthase